MAALDNGGSVLDADRNKVGESVERPLEIGDRLMFAPPLQGGRKKVLVRVEAPLPLVVEGLQFHE